MACFSVLLLTILSYFLESTASKEQLPNIIDGIGSIFSEVGFSPSCVADSLSICQKNLAYKQIVNLIDKMHNQIKGINSVKPRNCAEILSKGDTESGVRLVYPHKCCKDWAVAVFCDQETDGGGWTVIQHREDYPVREEFYRTWIEYKLGFGNLTGEFWLGLDNIHHLVSDTLMELRVDLEDFEGKRVFAKYDHFYISNENDKYRLKIGNYSGNSGDALQERHNGQQFSTKDQENDKNMSKHCSVTYLGAWWYGAQCHLSNLNGYPHKGNHSTFANGINWKPFRGYHYSLRKTWLSLRPVFRQDISHISQHRHSKS